MWVLGIIALVFSIWIGLEIEVRRDWIAGIFLFVVPTIILTSLIILTIRNESDQKAKKEETKLINDRVEYLKVDTSKINQILDTINKIKNTNQEVTLLKRDVSDKVNQLIQSVDGLEKKVDLLEKTIYLKFNALNNIFLKSNIEGDKDL
jgi:uncharacterized protein Yka (UPF0111/DUF47 family)